jgi:hypothetical protein
MSQKSNYREQIDACRPGSADLSLPALAELAGAVEIDRAVADELTRSQCFDRSVSTAMHDVPLPAGLLERLEAKLAEADVTDAAGSTGDVALPPARFSRRNLLLAVSALAAVLLVAVGAALWPQPGRSISNEQLVEMASGWNRQVPQWNPLSPASLPPARFAAPLEVRKATGWQRFTTKDGQTGVVYNLTTGLRPSARLYVINSRDKFALPTTPFRELKDASGGIAIGAWHTGGLLYIVVVDRNGQKLSDFVREKDFAWAPEIVPADAPHS